MPPKSAPGRRPKINTKFVPLRVCEEYVLVTGGYSRHPEPALFRTKMAPAQGGVEKLIFLKVQAREPWLIAGAAGSKHVSQGLSGRTTMVEELRAKLEEACNGDPTLSDNIRCGGGAAASSSTADPMAQVAEDEVLTTEAVKKVAARRTRWFTNNCKNKVLEVTMPERAPQTGIDEGTRKARLYCEDRKTVWLCTKDADWALKYLRDQLQCKGVHWVAPGDRGPGAGPPPPVHVGDQAQPAQAGPPVVAGSLSFEDCVFAAENGVQAVEVDAYLSAELSSSTDDAMSHVADDDL